MVKPLFLNTRFSSAPESDFLLQMRTAGAMSQKEVVDQTTPAKNTASQEPSILTVRNVFHMTLPLLLLVVAANTDLKSLSWEASKYMAGKAIEHFPGLAKYLLTKGAGHAPDVINYVIQNPATAFSLYHAVGLIIPASLQIMRPNVGFSTKLYTWLGAGMLFSGSAQHADQFVRETITEIAAMPGFLISSAAQIFALASSSTSSAPLAIAPSFINSTAEPAILSQSSLEAVTPASSGLIATTGLILAFASHKFVQLARWGVFV